MRQKIKTMLKTLFLDSFIIKTKPRTVELKNNSAEDQTFTFPIGHVTGFFYPLFHHKYLILCKIHKHSLDQVGLIFQENPSRQTKKVHLEGA